MDLDIIELLERKVESLLGEYAVLKRENTVLREENQQLLGEREAFRERIDAVLKKMEGIGVQ